MGQKENKRGQFGEHQFYDLTPAKKRTGHQRGLY